VVLRRRLVAVLILLSVIGSAYAVFFTSALGVREVDVEGNHELTADQVREVAAVESGFPLIRLDTKAIADRVHTLPRVSSVIVERRLPGTVRLTIVERTPVGFIKGGDGAHLVDGTGMDYAVLPAPPVGLPELVLPKADQNDPATKAVVGVLTQLPEQLRPEVLSMTAGTGADVRITLSAGREVRWGSLANTPRKAAVLLVLLTREGTVFDVSSPELPTVS
jgi:cell division protein FtsQ